MADWKSDFDPEVITNQLEKSKKNTDDGSTSFTGFDHTYNTVILASMIRFNSEIPENHIRRIINQATFKAAPGGKINPSNLLSCVNQLERDYLKLPKTKFKLVTSISADFSAHKINFREENAHVYFGRKLSKRLQTSHLTKLEEAEKSIYGKRPHFYAPVTALVNARNSEEAATKALDQIDLYRAIWNFWRNRGQRIRLSFGAHKPVNFLILGPIHTLHTLEGDLATDQWWYEPTYLGPVDIWRDERSLPNLLRFTANVRASLKKLSYRGLIEKMLIRYVRILDLRDWDSVFLELWSILEGLTGTGISDSHRVTVKRAAFMFKDRDYAIQMLNHLRYYRNSAVHEGLKNQNVEPIMYQCKLYVESLFSFHLSRAGTFETFADAVAFLDSPFKLEDIDRQIKNLKKVKKFIQG